jgi:membrane protease YdiL (CAAX protease family)
MLAVSAVVLAPLAEESLFRGLLFRRILERVGPWPAYVVSALAFAAIHGNLAGLVIYVWLGLVFAETLRRTGRLWTAIVVHMGNNAFALSLLVTG